MATSKFFTVDLIPDCIAGDVSDNNGADITGGDIIFNWTAIDIPKGSCMLQSCLVSTVCAASQRSRLGVGGRRIIQKQNIIQNFNYSTTCHTNHDA